MNKIVAQMLGEANFHSPEEQAVLKQHQQKKPRSLVKQMAPRPKASLMALPPSSSAPSSP